jgi:hypothetical protein
VELGGQIELCALRFRRLRHFEARLHLCADFKVFEDAK